MQMNLTTLPSKSQETSLCQKKQFFLSSLMKTSPDLLGDTVTPLLFKGMTIPLPQLYRTARTPHLCQGLDPSLSQGEKHRD